MTEPVPVLLPKVTMAATEGTFVEWLVGDGEAVVEDQPLYVMSFDKVDTEVASPATGILWRGLIEPGDTYPVGTELALIEPPGG